MIFRELVNSVAVSKKDHGNSSVAYSNSSSRTILSNELFYHKDKLVHLTVQFAPLFWPKGSAKIKARTVGMKLTNIKASLLT